VLRALSSDLDWLARTSPPTHAEGLVERLSNVRGIAEEALLVGPGSSGLIYHAFRSWLHPGSRVLLIEPTYGEYAHLCEKVVGARVDRITLRPEDGFQLDLVEWRRQIERHPYDLAVLVNPNNPPGGVLPRQALREVLETLPSRTRVWLDEAYMDYVGDETCEGFAAESGQTFVVKSLSKGFALSGLRAAYLVGPPSEIRELSRWCPPWSVGSLAQVAAVKALEDPDYYQRRYRETQDLREQLSSRLNRLGGKAVGGAANWVLYRLPEEAVDAAEVVAATRAMGVHIRDAGRSAPSLGHRYVRIAVKPPEEMDLVLDALVHAMERTPVSLVSRKP